MPKLPRKFSKGEMLMKIKVAQLFTRKISVAKEPNTYMVCGIIRTDTPLDVESTHLISADDVKLYESRDVSDHSRGNDIEGVMRSPIWKIRL